MTEVAETISEAAKAEVMDVDTSLESRSKKRSEALASTSAGKQSKGYELPW